MRSRARPRDRSLHSVKPSVGFDDEILVVEFAREERRLEQSNRECHQRRRERTAAQIVHLHREATIRRFADPSP